MFEKSTNLLSKWSGKWSGNELENDFLIASIVGTQVNLVNHVNLVNLGLNLNLNWKLELECLDQLILVAQLPDVSVTSTNGYSYLL